MASKPSGRPRVEPPGVQILVVVANHSKENFEG